MKERKSELDQLKASFQQKEHASSKWSKILGATTDAVTQTLNDFHIDDSAVDEVKKLKNDLKQKGNYIFCLLIRYSDRKMTVQSSAFHYLH